MKPHQRTQLAVQTLRRGAQGAAIALVAGLAYLSLYGHYRAANARDVIPGLKGVTGVVLSALDRGVSALGDPERLVQGFKGTLWSMRLGAIEVTDPLAALEITATSRTFHGPLWLSILVPVVATLLLGRVFCSWMCPGYLLFETGGKLRKLLRLAELPPAAVRFSRYNKYFFLGAGLLVSAVASRPLFALVYPPAVASRLIHAWVFGTAATGMLVILGAILAFEVLVSPRWFCRTLCPGGALLGLLGAARPLRVRFAPERCTGCRGCEPVCEQGLRPVAESEGIECDNCGQCVRHCPERALTFTVGAPGRRKAPARAAEQLAAVVLWLAVGLLALDPSMAFAHHILGLPHYSYKENYPQVPTLEYPATTGPYDVLLTSFPGKPKPNERVSLAFYIKNRETGVPYDQTVALRVLQTFTFGGNRELVKSIRLHPMDGVHKQTVTFDREGEYVAELSLEVEGKTEVIPFLMVVGEPSSAWSVLAMVGGGLAVFLIGVRAVKIKRSRRVAAGAPLTQA